MHNAVALSGIQARDDEDEAIISFADFLTMKPHFSKIHGGPFLIIMQYFGILRWFIIDHMIRSTGHDATRDLENIYLRHPKRIIIRQAD